MNKFRSLTYHFLIRHRVWAQTIGPLVALAASVALGYGISHSNPWYWLFTIPAALAFGLVAITSHATAVLSRKRVKEILGGSMEAIARAFAAPKDWSEAGMRVGCHIANRENNVLRPLLFVGPGQWDDQGQDIPISQTGKPFVIAQVYRERCVLKQNVKGDTEEERKLNTRPDIGSVIAAPIFVNKEAIGTVSIDSNVPLEQWSANSSCADQVIRNLAAAAAAVIPGNARSWRI